MRLYPGRPHPWGGAWSIQGDTDPDWLARGAPFGGIRREGANDSTSSIATGQFLVLGATPTNDYTNITATLTDTKVKHKGTTGTQTILGLAVRFSLNGSQPNCLLLAVRAKRRNDGKYKVFLSLYKLTGSTPTVTKIKDLDQYDGRALDIETLRLAVDTAGTWTVTAGAVPGPRNRGWEIFLGKSGTDSALATSGALETGRVAIYSCVQSTNAAYAFTEVGRIDGSAEATVPVESNVIRGSGTGSDRSLRRRGLLGRRGERGPGSLGRWRPVAPAPGDRQAGVGDPAGRLGGRTRHWPRRQQRPDADPLPGVGDALRPLGIGRTQWHST